MSNNLKTLKTDYVANRRVRQYGGRLNTKQYNAYNRMPDMITTNNNYYWEQGFNKRYGRHALLVKPNAVNDQLNNFTLKIDRQLQMTDFYYDNVSKKDLKLIRQRFKKAPMNLKGYNAIVKDYSHSFHARVKRYIGEARKQLKSINTLTDNGPDVVITLSGKPLESADVVWKWLRLTPEEADKLSSDKLEAKQKRLYDLSATVERLLLCIQQTDVILPAAYLNYHQKIDEARARKRKGYTT